MPKIKPLEMQEKRDFVNVDSCAVTLFIQFIQSCICQFKIELKYAEPIKRTHWERR